MSKVFNVWAKKLQRSNLSWNWKRDTKCGEESTPHFKIRIRIFTKFDPSTRKSQKFSIYWIPFEQSIYILFELKKYRGIIFNETEEGYKIWRGIDVFFENWHKKFDKFWPEHSKVSKTLNLMGFFWAKYILGELRKLYYRGLILHETEKGYKIWSRIDLSFQNWQKEFDKF